MRFNKDKSVAQNTVRFTSFITALSCLLMVWRSLSKQSLSRKATPRDQDMIRVVSVHLAT